MNLKLNTLLSGMFAVACATGSSAQTSEAHIAQVGGSNVADVAQLASAAFLAQTGTGNEAYIEQAGGGGHLVRLDQFDGSFAEITQMGSDNWLAGLAGTAESVALQREASRLVLAQDGTGNRAFVEQTAGSFAQITQNGIGNTATVIQN